MEDKQKILDLLLPALQATRNLAELVGLEYREDRELVYAKFKSGRCKIIDLSTAKSGLDMLEEVIAWVGV